MANSLLDFVISLVRDPEAASRYAANPDQTIADAHLTNVTSTDVSNLIPMVSDSLSMASPAAGPATAHAADHGNVWASGAATALTGALAAGLAELAARFVGDDEAVMKTKAAVARLVQLADDDSAAYGAFWHGFSVVEAGKDQTRADGHNPDSGLAGYVSPA